MAKRLLTQAALDALELRQTEYEVPDPAVPGIWYRVYPTGGRSVVIRYRGQDGKQRRHSIGRVGPRLSLARAQGIARAKLNAIAGGADPSHEKKEARKAKVEQETTVSVIVASYLAEHVKPKRKPSTYESYEVLAKHIDEGLGTVPVRELTRKAVEAWHRKMGTGKDARPGAANRALAVLSAAWNHAVRHDVVDKANPCKGIAKFRERQVERFLDADERARLVRTLDHCRSRDRGHPDYVSPGACDAIKMLMLTGMRLEEALTLTWSMVDVRGKRLYLPDSKAGKKTVWLSDDAVELLKSMGSGRGDALVFRSETGEYIHNIQRGWRAIRRRADLEDVRLHDLRHAYASDAIMAGVPLEVVGRLLGHKSVLTTKRYAHLSDGVVADAAERAAAALKGK